jgi:hypothetical protein
MLISLPEIGVATPARVTEATAHRTASRRRILLKRAIFSLPLTNIKSTLLKEIFYVLHSRTYNVGSYSKLRVLTVE